MVYNIFVSTENPLPSSVIKDYVDPSRRNNNYEPPSDSVRDGIQDLLLQVAANPTDYPGELPNEVVTREAEVHFSDAIQEQMYLVDQGIIIYQEDQLVLNPKYKSDI